MVKRERGSLALSNFKKSHKLENAENFEVFKELISEIEILKFGLV